MIMERDEGVMVVRFVEIHVDSPAVVKRSSFSEKYDMSRYRYCRHRLSVYHTGKGLVRVRIQLFVPVKISKIIK